MRKLIASVVLALASLGTVDAFATCPQGTPKLSWTLPTSNTDGSAIPSGTPITIHLYARRTATETWQKFTPAAGVTSPVREYQTPPGVFPPGNVTFMATATVAGKESIPSNTVSCLVGGTSATASPRAPLLGTPQ